MPDSVTDWLTRFEVCLLIVTIARIQYLAYREGEGWRLLPIHLILLAVGLFVAGSLGGDYLGQVGHMSLIVFSVGLWYSRRVPMTHDFARMSAGHGADEPR